MLDAILPRLLRRKIVTGPDVVEIDDFCNVARRHAVLHYISDPTRHGYEYLFHCTPFLVKIPTLHFVSIATPVCNDLDPTASIEETPKSIGNRLASLMPTVSFGGLSARDEFRPKDPTTRVGAALTGTARPE
jgi:hypothetical protein